MTNLHVSAKINYGDVFVGRVSSILVFIERQEKTVKLFLFEEYRTIAREGSQIIFRVNNDNKVKRIDIFKDIDFENTIKLPENGSFISIIKRNWEE